MFESIDWKAAQPALFHALSQLAVIGIAGFFANIIIRRYKEVMTAREDLLKDIDQFGIQIYKPRKIYEAMIDRCQELLPSVCNAEEREKRRLETIHRVLDELVDATGRLRTFQVKIVQVYGFNMDLLAHYLAIWRFTKEMRRKMEKGESLYPAGARPQGDAFFRLFDSFRYRVSSAKYLWRTPKLVQPSPELLAEMRAAGARVYVQYFGEEAKPASVPPAEERQAVPLSSAF